jgi:hypothetical protein
MGVVALAFFSRPLHAEPARRFTLSFSAETGCVTEQELVDQVRRYLPHAERASTKPSDIDARVVITPLAEGARAVVDVQRAEGPSHREIDGTCAEVTRAVALILAMSLDPDQHLTEPTVLPLHAPTSSANATSKPSVDANSGLNPSSDASRSSHPNPHSTPDTNRTKIANPSARDSTSRWWIGGGASLGLGTGIAPEPSAHAGLFIEFGRQRAGWFAPSFRLSGTRAQNETDRAYFTFLGARVAGCPLRIGAGAFLEPCVTFEYGNLEAAGHSVARASSASARIFGPGLSLHAGTRVGGALVLALDVGVTVPLVRDRFFFAPDITVHRVPALMGYAGLALGLRS